MKRWTLDEERGDIRYEVIGDNLVLKIKPEFIAGIKTPVSGGGGGGGGGIYHIKLNDLVIPTDENAFTALRTLKEIDNALTDYIVDIDAMYLRKDIDDTAHGNILFDKMIGSTAYIDGFDGKGWRILEDGSSELEGIRVRSDIFLGGKVGSPSFASGFTGWGWEIDTPTASGTVDNWTVRKSMKVYELVYSQIYGLSGSTLVTDFNKIKEVTPLGTNRYHCTLDDVDGTMFMNLRDGDIVRLQKRDGWNIRYYYAEVENVAMESFDLKVIDGTDTPEPGDVAFRMGNKTDKNRQGLIYLTSSDDYAAYIDILDGVTDHRFTQDNTKVRLGNLRGIRVNGQPLDMHGIYINGGVFQHSRYYLDDGTTIEQQFSIMDGRLESLINGVRDDISGEKGNVLRNSAFATSLHYWEYGGNVHFIPVEGGFLYTPYSFYVDKESVADLYKEGGRKMLRIRSCSIRQFNDYMSLPDHPLLTLPSLPDVEPPSGEIQMTQFTYSFSFHYRVIRSGRLTAGIEGSSLWVDEELQASDAFTLCFKEGMWDEKGDFIISFTGEILIYGATLRNDAEADNFLRFETGIEQTYEQIRLWATKEMKDQEGKLTTLFTSQLQITAEQISGISTKVDNIKNTIETAGWITRAEGVTLFAKKEMENGKSIVNAINVGTGGILIQANRINLKGAVSFTMLSDYSTVNSRINEKADSSSLKSLAYQDKVEIAQLGSTIISGGHIVTSLIDTDSIYANMASIGGFKIENNGIFSNSKYTGESSSKFFLYSSGNEAFLGFSSSGKWAGLGLNTLPSTLGGTSALMRLEYTTNHNDINYGAVINVHGGKLNYALYCTGALKVNGAISTARYVRPGTYTDTIIKNIGYMDTYLFQPTSYMNVYLPSRKTVSSKMGNVYNDYGDSWSEIGYNSVVFIHVIVSRHSSDAICVRPEDTNTPLVNENGDSITLDMRKGDCATFAYFNQTWYLFSKNF